MPVGFYELLQIPPDAPPEAVRAAYQEQIAQVVRKQRAAEARHQDPSTIEARRLALAEAFAVLGDPPRRRRYDRFREISRGATPTDPEELWAQAASSLVDPAAAAALEVVRTLTDLKVGEPLTTPPSEPEVRELRPEQRTDLRAGPSAPVADGRGAERLDTARHDPSREGPRAEARPEPRGEARPEPRVEPRPEPRSEARPEPRGEARPEARHRGSPSPTGASPDARRAPPPTLSPDGGRPDARERSEHRTEGWPMDTRPDQRERREPRAPATASLTLHRSVPAETLARLADEYGPTGAYLRAARELRRITVEDLSRTTHISQRFLEAMERDAFTELPAATFVRGYLKMVVRALELLPASQDVDELVDGYMSRFHRVRG